MSYYQDDERIKAAVDFLLSHDMLAAGDGHSLDRLAHELMCKDWFMTFPDFDAYLDEKDRMLEAAEDEATWQSKCLVNIAKAGFFSSDRTIRQYNEDIWHLEE
jgi:starch phosphorylase